MDGLLSAKQILVMVRGTVTHTITAVRATILTLAPTAKIKIAVTATTHAHAILVLELATAAQIIMELTVNTYTVLIHQPQMAVTTATAIFTLASAHATKVTKAITAIKKNV